MGQVNTFGKLHSLRIFDDSRKGEIILRVPPDPSPPTKVTLKLSNDHDSAFDAMAALAAAGIEFGTGATTAVPNVHVSYDDGDMEIDEITLHYH
jgi:hypothetical protein